MIKRNQVLAALTGLGMLAAAGLALAQTPAKPAASEKKSAGYVDHKEFEAAFKKADTNGDGALSKDEVAKAKGLPAVKKNFDAMDTNKDGKVTVAERYAWEEARKAKPKK